MASAGSGWAAGAESTFAAAFDGTAYGGVGREGRDEFDEGAVGEAEDSLFADAGGFEGFGEFVSHLLIVRDALIDEKEEIGRILCLEHGKPWKEAQGEVEYAAGFFDYCAKNIRNPFPI